MTTRPAALRGFGLIELMVALSIGLLLVLAVGQVYLTLNRGRSTVTNVADLQESARFLTERFKRDVRMAGYLGATYQKWNSRTSTVSPLPSVSNECFLPNNAKASFRWAAPIDAGALGLPPPKIYGSDNGDPFSTCLGANRATNSDVLSLHFAAPTPISAANLAGPNFYLQTSVGGAFGFYCAASVTGTNCLPSDKPSTTAGSEYYRLISRLYWVRDWGREVGDGRPTLMLTEYSGSSVQTQPLVNGVAVFQVSYGVDTDNDGAIDAFRSASEIGDLTTANLPLWNRVKSVEIRYVLRGLEPDSTRLNSTDKVYAINGQNYTVDGDFLSREFKITAALRNPVKRPSAI